MSRQQQYLANALACAQRREASDEPAERLRCEQAEQAWLVLAGVEPPPAQGAVKACREGYRPGWFTG
jgi:hypothetical protein